MAPVAVGALMIMAPEASFGSAARADAASSAVRDVLGTTVAGIRIDSVCFGVAAAGVAGAIFSSDGAISFDGFDAAGLIAVGVCAAHAGSVRPMMTKPNPNIRIVFMPLVVKTTHSGAPYA